MRWYGKKAALWSGIILNISKQSKGLWRPLLINKK